MVDGISRVVNADPEKQYTFACNESKIAASWIAQIDVMYTQMKYSILGNDELFVLSEQLANQILLLLW